MTAKVIDGKAIAAGIRQELKKRIEKERLSPSLAVVLVGDDPASKVYIRMKSRACEEVDIHSDTFILPEDTTQEDVIKLVEAFNKDPKVHGILVQLPLPEHINEREVIEKIAPEKDVDGLTPENMGKLLSGEGNLTPCTPRGVMKLIESTGVELEGKHAIVVGRSNLVGKPVSLLLQRKHCTVTMCHSRSKPLEGYTKQADVLVVAVGRPKLITADMVKEGVVVIDVGVNRLEDGSLCGDVDFESVKERAAFITPVPGGVGPMTIACLLENTVNAST